MTALDEIAAERQRQIDAEGWDHGHDDTHEYGELAMAAAAYALQCGFGRFSTDAPPNFWPWDRRWWKVKDPRRNLIRAAALIVAEIERLDRKGRHS